MKNTLKCFGIIALIAIIGIFMTACGGPSGKDLPPGMKPGNPPSNSLSPTKAGINQTTLNKIGVAAAAKSLSYGGNEYQGYVLFEPKEAPNMGMLTLYWSNRNDKSFESVIEALEAELEDAYIMDITFALDQTIIDFMYGEGTSVKPGDILMAAGTYGDFASSIKTCSVIYFNEKVTVDGGSIPAGFLAVGFMWINF